MNLVASVASRIIASTVSAQSPRALCARGTASLARDGRSATQFNASAVQRFGKTIQRVGHKRNCLFAGGKPSPSDSVRVHQRAAASRAPSALAPLVIPSCGARRQRTESNGRGVSKQLNGHTNIIHFLSKQQTLQATASTSPRHTTLQAAAFHVCPRTSTAIGSARNGPTVKSKARSEDTLTYNLLRLIIALLNIGPPSLMSNWD